MVAISVGASQVLVSSVILRVIVLLFSWMKNKKSETEQAAP